MPEIDLVFRCITRELWGAIDSGVVQEFGATLARGFHEEAERLTASTPAEPQLCAGCGKLRGELEKLADEVIALNEDLDCDALAAKLRALAALAPDAPEPIEMCEWCDEPVENSKTHGEGACFDQPSRSLVSAPPAEPGKDDDG